MLKYQKKPKIVFIKTNTGQNLVFSVREINSEKNYLDLRKVITLGSIISLISALAIFGLFLAPKSNTSKVQANGLCTSDVDAVLVMDISGSMANGAAPSKCEWENLEWVENEFGGTYMCISHSQNGLTEQQCQAKKDTTGPCSYEPVKYTPPVPKKLEAAKTAAKSFIDNLESFDQSALVSFSDTAQIVKILSFDHTATKNAIDSLATAAGATNIGDAIAQANTELSSERANPKSIKAMILLTDGKANKPNGDGYAENPADVAYAESKAQEAANLGYKIFTIGLGEKTSINETMLQNIANTTGARYYYAPSHDQLSVIYNEIAAAVCQYGSISGCKYQDVNNDGDIEDEDGLSGWEIVLSGDTSMNQLTDENGCYTFAGLLPGSYTISEGENSAKQPWLQTFPEDNLYNIILEEGQNLAGFDFGNYFPSCGNDILDSDFGEECDDGNTQNKDGCSATCQIEPSILGQKLDYVTERGLAGWVIQLRDQQGNIVASTTTDENGFYAFYDLVPGNYIISESLEENWVQISPNDSNYYNPDWGYYWFQAVARNQIVTGLNFANANKSQCQAVELSRQCIGDASAQVNYAYNYPFCGQNYTVTEQDFSCSSQYQCSEWQNTSCTANSVMNQTRTCQDQYQNSYEDSREIFEQSCACVAQETSKTCTIDGTADVSYSWNYSYCGQNYNVPQEDSSCACIETPVAGQCIGDNQRQYTFSYNFSYCQNKNPEIREDSSCGCSYSEWQNSECVGDGLRRQFRNQISDFTYCTSLEQVISDAICQSSGEEPQEPQEPSQPSAPQAVISGCKYKDANKNNQIDAAEEKLANWTIILEKQNGQDWNQISNVTTSGEGENHGCYQFGSLEAGNYRVKESLENQTNWLQTYPQAPSYHEIALGQNETLQNINFANYLPVCGNAILDQNEACDDGNTTSGDGCSATCQTEETNAPETPESQTPPQGSSAGAASTNIGTAFPFFGTAIREDMVRATGPQETSITIGWLTTNFSTSRVIYAAEGQPHILDMNDNTGNPPKYGYAHTTPEYDIEPKVTWHSITINDLASGTTYYFRTVSRASPPAISQERSFITLGTKVELIPLSQPEAVPPSPENVSPPLSQEQTPSPAPTEEQGIILPTASTTRTPSGSETVSPEQPKPQESVVSEPPSSEIPEIQKEAPREQGKVLGTEEKQIQEKTEAEAQKSEKSSLVFWLFIGLIVGIALLGVVIMRSRGKLSKF